MSELPEPTDPNNDEKPELVATEAPADTHDEEKPEPVATEAPTDTHDDEKPEPVENEEPSDDLGRRMSIWQHLDEFRKRLLFSVVAWLIATSVAFSFMDRLLKLVMRPAGDITLNSRYPLEGMLTLMKVSMAAGIVATSPIILYQIWAFVSPGLYVRERRWVARFFFPVAILLFLGVAFGHLGLAPIMLKVLIEFPRRYGIVPVISPDSMLSFILFVDLSCGLIFQMPVITYILSKIGILSPQFLVGNWKYITVGLLLAAGILTPDPSPVSMFVLFVPMMLLYGVSYFVALAAYPRKRA